MRRLVPLLSALPLLVPLGACGTDPGADRPAPADPAVVRLATTVTDRTETNGSAHLTFTGEAAGQRMRGSGAITFGDDAALRMDLSTPRGEMSVVFHGTELFVRPPTAPEPGRPWVRVGAAEAGGDRDAAQLLGAVFQSLRDNADPGRTLGQFAMAGTVTETTDEKLAGTRVTRHAITVDVRRLADGQPDPALRRALTESADAGMTEFPVRVWLDRRDLPSRLSLQIPATNPDTGETTTSTVRIDYTDWGTPVEISAPPADRVADLPR